MSDKITKAQRSRIMSSIRSSKTAPELKLKPLMKRSGFVYQPKTIYGRPDFANRKLRIVVFVDGCFWHKCPKHYVEPSSNKAYWKSKILYNVRRDRAVNKRLEWEGWMVIRVWEHEL